MKLQLLLIEKGINKKAEFKTLPNENQRQLKITLNRYYGLKVSPKDAFARHCVCDFWRIVEISRPEKPLYDFWEIDSDYGLIFYSGSIKQAGIKFVASRFVLDGSSSLSQGSLFEDLQNAERIDVDRSSYLVDDDNYVVDFKASFSIPDSIAKWRSLLKKIKVNEEFINTYSRYFDKKCWEAIAQNSQLAPVIVRRYGKKLGWANVSFYQRLTEDQIREFRNDVDWRLISWKQDLSEAFIHEFANQVSWQEISKYQHLSIDFIKDHKDRICFNVLAPKSLEHVSEFQNEDLNWCLIVSNLECDDNFIVRYHDKFDSTCWSIISKRFQLSTSILEKFALEIDWASFSENQNITDEQLVKFKDRIDWKRFAAAGKIVSAETLTQVQETLLSYESDTDIDWAIDFGGGQDKFTNCDSGNLILVKSLETV